jgi:hypothetical protein
VRNFVKIVLAVLAVSLVFGCATIQYFLTQEVSWSANAKEWRGQNGMEVTVRLPGNGSAHTVWGTDVYTDDSSIGTAAVHAGIIDFENGGIVTIEIRPGQESYEGSTRNGVTTEDYGSYAGSFVFVVEEEEE